MKLIKQSKLLNTLSKFLFIFFISLFWQLSVWMQEVCWSSTSHFNDWCSVALFFSVYAVFLFQINNVPGFNPNTIVLLLAVLVCSLRVVVVCYIDPAVLHFLIDWWITPIHTTSLLFGFNEVLCSPNSKTVIKNDSVYCSAVDCNGLQVPWMNCKTVNMSG